MLLAEHEVVLFEQSTRLGGHARTLTVPRPEGAIAVDTGFIVYNEVNYPLLTNYFAMLGVPTKASEMSFGVSYGNGALEFSASSLAGLFAQRRNLASPRYLGMLFDIRQFFKAARSVYGRYDDPTLGEFIESLGLGSWFRDRFLLPMGAAIWSTSARQMMLFPAKTFVRFFDNHALLGATGQHPWRTVVGGSQSYVEILAARLGASARPGATVVRVERRQGGIVVTLADGGSEVFDEVVFACHADVALRLLAEPDQNEREILGAFRFRDNEAVLHSDMRVMPNARGAWASWNYSSSGEADEHDVSVTYWMNKLQGIDGGALFVSLNPDREIAAEKTFDRHTFRHPEFSQAAINAQGRMGEIQGVSGVWYCGAWQRNGFHEDGLWSAVRVVEAKGLSVPWR